MRLRNSATANRRTGSGVRCWLMAAVAAGLLLGAAAPAAADEYDAGRAGHPLRILAYVAHPIGVFFDYLIFRPAHWLASHEPLRTLVGHQD